MDGADPEPVLDFDEWLSLVFHFTRGSYNRQYDPRLNRFGDEHPDLTVRHVARLFGHPSILDGYTENQVAMGLEFLVKDVGVAIHSLRAPCDLAVAAVKSMATLFTGYVAKHCGSPFFPSGRRRINSSRLERVCEGWWEDLPIWPSGKFSYDARIIEALRHAMVAALRTDHIFCQEWALDGLGLHGYGHHFFPDGAQEAVEEFLRRVGPGHPLADDAAIIRDNIAELRDNISEQ